MLSRFLICLVLLAPVISASNAAEKPTKPPAVSEIIKFTDWIGPDIPVYLLRPANVGADAPVVFVMHGVKRDADRYFDEWRPFAEKYGFILVVPEFSAKSFPKAANYNLGGVVDRKGAVTPREGWAYSSIEPLFDAVVRRLDLSSREYVVYGHSAGAQFVHRFALFGSGKRARMVISANAGWYTFPDAGLWPYGPDGLSGGVYDRDAALGAPLIILAGEADTDPNHPSLRRTPEANAQGATRYARALAFYQAGSELAHSSHAVFHWSCVTAPNVDHNDAKVAPFAVALIFEASRQPGEPCQRVVPAE